MWMTEQQIADRPCVRMFMRPTITAALWFTYGWLLCVIFSAANPS